MASKDVIYKIKEFALRIQSLCKLVFVIYKIILDKTKKLLSYQCRDGLPFLRLSWHEFRRL